MGCCGGKVRSAGWRGLNASVAGGGGASAGNWPSAAVRIEAQAQPTRWPGSRSRFVGLGITRTGSAKFYRKPAPSKEPAPLLPLTRAVMASRGGKP